MEYKGSKNISSIKNSNSKHKYCFYDIPALHTLSPLIDFFCSICFILSFTFSHSPTQPTFSLPMYSFSLL